MKLLVVTAVAGLAVLGAASAARVDSSVSGWLTYGNDVRRSSATSSPLPARVRPRWSRKLSGGIVSQPLAFRSPSGLTIVIGTTRGLLYALDASGRVRWKRQLAQVVHPCKQLDSYGVTGTPAVDPATGTIYVADALGELHALDPESGVERAGWPVALYTDPRAELVWGALTLVDGAVYAGTGSYCDEPMEGKLVRVDTQTRRVTSWTTVSASEGGGGSIWGWGGVSFSAARDSLLAVTGNAFRGGANDGPGFREWAGYGEHLLELSPDLELRSSDHPRGLTAPDDLDFVGSPVLVARPGCGELVAALNKNGVLYAWRADQIEAGVVWHTRVATGGRDPLLSQTAYSSSSGIVVTSAMQVIAVGVSPGCKPQVAWRFSQPRSLSSTPTVAGGRIWFVRWHKRARLVALDARTGRLRQRIGLDRGLYFVGPAVLGERLYLGSFDGVLRALG